MGKISKSNKYFIIIVVVIFIGLSIGLIISTFIKNRNNNNYIFRANLNPLPNLILFGDSLISLNNEREVVYVGNCPDSEKDWINCDYQWAIKIPGKEWLVMNSQLQDGTEIKPGAIFKINNELKIMANYYSDTRMKSPVGGCYSNTDKSAWVAFFGGWPYAGEKNGKSGIMKINNYNKQDEYPFILSKTERDHYKITDLPNIHNVYEFVLDRKPEIFVAVLGAIFKTIHKEDWDPVDHSPERGLGLVRFDKETEKYDLSGKEPDQGPLNIHARSAKQTHNNEDNTVVLLSQEPESANTILYLLKWKNKAWTILNKFSLPPRDSKPCPKPNEKLLCYGDGGGDVILGKENSTFFVSDRWVESLSGKIYYLEYYTDGFIIKRTIDVDAPHPRYMIASNDDILTCNQTTKTITFFKGLFKNPIDYNEKNTQLIPSVVDRPSFISLY